MGRVTLRVGGVELEGVEVDGHLVLTPADFATVGGQVVALAEEAGPAPARRDVSLSASSCSPSRGRSLGRARSGSCGGGGGKGVEVGAEVGAAPRAAAHRGACRHRRLRPAGAATEQLPHVSRTRHANPSAGAAPEAAARGLRSRTVGPPHAAHQALLSRRAHLSSLVQLPRPHKRTSPLHQPCSEPVSSPSVLQPWYCRCLVCSANRTQQPQVSRSPFFLQPVPRTLPPWWRPAAGLPPRSKAN